MESFPAVARRLDGWSFRMGANGYRRRMPNEYADPSGNTQAFRAFAQTTEPPAPAPSRLPLLIGLGVAAVLAIAVLVWAVM